MGTKIKLPSCENCESRSKGIFNCLSGSALNDVSNNKVTNVYKRGQAIFYQDNPSFGLYCVSSGKIKISKLGQDGKESIIRIAGPGDVLGHRSLFSNENYSATATVLEDAVICFLDKKYIFNEVKQEPTVALNIIQKLSKEMGFAESRSASISQKSVKERIAELFLMLKSSYGVKEGNRYRLEIKLTREEIASMIGTANETAIRLISEFKEDGILEQEGKVIYILDEEKLIELANVGG